MKRLQEMKLIAEGSERDRLELQKQLDAQRLRADTAEANFNRCNGLYYEFQKDRDTLRSDLAAAEQRIAEMRELLVEVQKAARKQAWAHGYPTLFAAVDAALNPNPEAESHESAGLSISDLGLKCIDEEIKKNGMPK